MAKQDKTQKMREELWSTFLHEVEDLLDALEQQLLDIEKDLSNRDLIAGLFRTMHTLKGTCGMMGLGNVENLAHKAEDIMDLVRENKMELTSSVLDLMFETLDKFKEARECIVETKKDVESQSIEALIQALKKQFDNHHQAPSPVPTLKADEDGVILNRQNSGPVPDKDYIKLYFELVWSNLNQIKKHLQNFTQDTFNCQVSGLLDEIVHASKQLNFQKACDVLERFKTECAKHNDIAAISMASNQVWHFFWDLEDELQNMPEPDPDQSPSSFPLAGENGAESENETQDIPEPAPDLPPVSGNDRIEPIDPLFIVDFLEKFEEDIARFKLLSQQFLSDPISLSELTCHLNQMSDEAQRLNLQPVSDSLNQLLRQLDNHPEQVNQETFSEFELALFKKLALIEDAQPEDIKETLKDKINISYIFKHWHAERCFGQLAQLNNFLQLLPNEIELWLSGAMNDASLSALLDQCISKLESLLFTCQYYHIPAGEKGVLDIIDFFLRVQMDLRLLNGDFVEVTDHFLMSLGQAIQQLLEAGDYPAEVLKASAQAIRTHIAGPVRDNFTRVAEEFFAELSIPECLESALTSSVLHTVGEAILQNKNLFLLYCDIEDNETLSNDFYDFLQSGLFQSLISATDYVEDRPVFYFLVCSVKGALALLKQLEAIDPSKSRLSITQLQREKTKTMEGPMEGSEETPEIGPDPDQIIQLNELQNTVGQLISVRTNITQIAQNISHMDLYEMLDKQLAKHEGQWNDVRHQVKELINQYEVEVKGLIDAQEDISNVLDKLQDNLTTVREMACSAMTGPLEKWFAHVCAQRSLPVTLKISGQTLMFDRERLRRLEKPLRQWLFAAIQSMEPESQTPVTFGLKIESTGQGKRIYLNLRESPLDPRQPVADNQAVAGNSAQDSDIRMSLTTEYDKIVQICFDLDSDNHILEGIVVVSNEIYYVIPVTLVKRIIDSTGIQITHVSAADHESVIQVDHKTIALHYLNNTRPPEKNQHKIILVLEREDVFKAILVDDLIGLQQVLVNPLQGQLEQCAGFCGCAILGRDRIGMVMHSQALFS